MDKKISIFGMTVILSLSTMMFVPAAYAQTENYSFELGASLTRGDAEWGGSTRDYRASATYYFSEVPLANAPWAEAAFLARASSLTIDGGRTSLRMYGYRSLDINFYGGAIDIYFPGAPLLIGAEFFHGKASLNNSYDNYFDEDYIISYSRVTLGILPTRGMLIGTSIAREQESGDEQIYTVNQFDLNFKYIVTFGDSMAAGIDYFIEYSDFDNSDSSSDILYAGTLLFYPVPWLELGLVFGKKEGIMASLFLGPMIGLSASYMKFSDNYWSGPNGGWMLRDSHTFAASVVIRF